MGCNPYMGTLKKKKKNLKGKKNKYNVKIKFLQTYEPVLQETTGGASQ